MPRKASLRYRASILVICVAVGISMDAVQATTPGETRSDAWLIAEKAEHTPSRLTRLREVMDVHRRHAKRLSGVSNVIASGTSLEPDGEPCIKVFVTHPDTRGIPDFLEGVRVRKQESARFHALRRTTCETSRDQVCELSERWPLPVPIGVSVGHPGVTAGTAGARVTDGINVLLLSNNHVLANVNQANLGDAILQPGSIDGGVNPDDAIATLTDFEPIDLCRRVGFRVRCNENTIDAAVALSTPDELGVATPTDGVGADAGYGTPSSVLHPAYGIPDSLGDEDLAQLLGIEVQKYGLTTGQTAGIVDTINADVEVCYDPDCADVALFTDQLIISPDNFSAAGDSGSLVVDSLRQPVGLLFAGGPEFTIVNRIDLVLNRFGVEVDGDASKRLVAGHTPDAVTVPWDTVALPAGLSGTPVVLASLQTSKGRDTAGLRLRNLSAGGFEFKIEEEKSRDSETTHASERIGYLALEPGPLSDAFGSAIGEAGTISSEQETGRQWHTVSLQGIYSAPVVLMNMTTYNGVQPSHIRIRNVKSRSFEYQIEEWDYLDQSHIREDIGFAVLESGSHALPDGTRIEAGVIQTDHAWADVYFSAPYEAVPVALSQSQTANGVQAVITRHRNATSSGFKVRLQEEEANDNRHLLETIGYVAIAP